MKNIFTLITTFLVFAATSLTVYAEDSAALAQEEARVNAIVKELLYPLADYYSARVEHFVTKEMVAAAIIVFIVTFWLAKIMFSLINPPDDETKQD